MKPRSEWKLIAVRGETTELYDVGDGMGVIVDTANSRQFEPLPIQSILARGYWSKPSSNEED